MNERIIFDIENKLIYKVLDTYIIKCSKIKKQSKLINAYVQDSENLTFFLDRTKSLFTNDYISHYRTLQTDGSWIWSSDLNVYTKDYSFIWPKEFVNQVCKLKGKMRDLKDNDFSKLEAELVITGYYEDKYEDFIKIIPLSEE
ncbi:hypothetical protein ACWGOQ_0023690 [Aquimarina sp. M1]